eukprot:4012338-Prymnesium_polylepis.1
MGLGRLPERMHPAMYIGQAQNTAWSNENSGREFIELKFPSEAYITGFELYETYKPGSVYR